MKVYNNDKYNYMYNMIFINNFNVCILRLSYIII